MHGMKTQDSKQTGIKGGSMSAADIIPTFELDIKERSQFQAHTWHAGVLTKNAFSSPGRD